MTLLKHHVSHLTTTSWPGARQEMNWLQSGLSAMPEVPEAEEEYQVDEHAADDGMQVDDADLEGLEGPEEDDVNDEGYAPSVSSRSKGKGKQVYRPRSARIAANSQKKSTRNNS